MKSSQATAVRARSVGKLTRSRGEKISAVEGLELTPRMRSILARPGLTGDQRRALIRAAFVAKNSG